MTSSLDALIWVHASDVHGQGVFATRHLAAGERLIEYVGEIISMAEAIARHPHDETNPDHTFYFHLDDGRVIDALHGGNSARWINHCCTPNCKPEVIDGRVFIKAKKRIQAGAELNYDYGLIIDEPITHKLVAQYPCWCGSPKCRQTLLAHKLPSGKKEKKNKEKADEIRKAIQKLKSKLKRLTEV